MKKITENWIVESENCEVNGTETLEELYNLWEKLISEQKYRISLLSSEADIPKNLHTDYYIIHEIVLAISDKKSKGIHEILRKMRILAKVLTSDLYPFDRGSTSARLVASVEHDLMALARR